MGVFKNISVSTTKLRECQSEACSAAQEHYAAKDAEKHTLIQLPTGTGKS